MLTLIAREDVIDWISKLMREGNVTPDQALALSALMGWLMVDCPTYGYANLIDLGHGLYKYELMKGE